METRARKAARITNNNNNNDNATNETGILVANYTLKQAECKTNLMVPRRPRKKGRRSLLSPIVQNQVSLAKPVYFINTSGSKICKIERPVAHYNFNFISMNNSIPTASLSRVYSTSSTESYLNQMFWCENNLGHGSFGIVYKVRSKEDGKFYAIKQMKSTHPMKYGYAEVLNYEKVGDYPYFVKFILAWEQASIVYIQMEYCHMSLDQFSSPKFILEEKQLWQILYDICQALDHLNAKNLIHLDVKPANIMLTEECYKLADFGLLVDLNQHDGKKISTISDGDAKYLASEVLNGVYTFSCDIFSLGITLVELSTNIELPEFGPLWHHIRKNTLPPIFFDSVSFDFALIIQQMMIENCRKRPTADKILRTNSVLNAHTYDTPTSRSNYYTILLNNVVPNVHKEISMFNENFDSHIDTPHRPLSETHNFAEQCENIIESPKTPNENKLYENLLRKNLFKAALDI